MECFSSKHFHTERWALWHLAAVSTAGALPVPWVRHKPYGILSSMFPGLSGGAFPVPPIFPAVPVPAYTVPSLFFNVCRSPFALPGGDGWFLEEISRRRRTFRDRSRCSKMDPGRDVKMLQKATGFKEAIALRRKSG